jgi:hypothetical protein
MKVDIKITFSQLQVLVQAFQLLTPEPINNRDVKVARSVIDKVVVRLKKKHIDESVKTSLFTEKKKFKLSFEYYEAHFLEKFLEIIVIMVDNIYWLNVLNTIRSQINQKLA